MKKHVKALTYKPKIDAVLSGDCSQTIRTGRNVSVGDEILFHGWSGKPYRSTWSWRMRVVVTECIDIFISESGIDYWANYRYSNCRYLKCAWGGHACKVFAEKDFIDPPTGEALRDVLFKLNGIPKEPVHAQIIRW